MDSLSLSAQLTRTLTRWGQDQPWNSHVQGRTGRRLSCLGKGVLCDLVGGKYVKGSHYDMAHTMGLNTEHTNMHNIKHKNKCKYLHAQTEPFLPISQVDYSVRYTLLFCV